MPTIRKTVLTAAALCGLGLPAAAAHAAPFDRRQVAADARWVVHLDLDAARPTRLWRAVADHLAQQPRVMAKVAQVEVVTGVNFARDLHDVTVYGQTADDSAGVAVIHADVDRQRLLTIARGNDGFATHAHGKVDVVTWSDSGQPIFAAFFDDKTIVCGRTEAHVDAALDVLDGTAPALPADGPLTGAAPAATRPAFAAGGGRPLFFLAVDNSAGSSAPLFKPGADVPGFVQQVDGGWLTVAESTAAPVADVVRVALTAKTADAAVQLLTAAEGLKAMAAFATAGADADPHRQEEVELLKRVAIGRSDRTVTAELPIVVDELGDAIAHAKLDFTDRPPTTEPAVQVKVTVDAK